MTWLIRCFYYLYSQCALKKNIFFRAKEGTRQTFWIGINDRDTEKGIKCLTNESAHEIMVLIT